jgi:hypothetical protein
MIDTTVKRVDKLPPNTRKNVYRLALHEREEGEDVLRLITGTQDATFEQLEARQVRF